MTREHKSLGNFVLCLIVIVLILLFINNRESLPSFNMNKNADTNLDYYDDNPNSNSSRDNMSRYYSTRHSRNIDFRYNN